MPRSVAPRQRHPQRAKTYDAEYVAAAQLLGCKLVTLDSRLQRGAERLGIVVTLDEVV